MADPTTNLTIRVKIEDKKKLEKIARDNERSVNYLVNKAIKKFLEEFPDSQTDN